MHPHRFPSFFLWSVIVIFFLIQAPRSFSDDNERYLSCKKTISCGNVANMGYPFWGEDRPEHCGHPGFRLNCAREYPEMTINAVTYRVLRIIPPARSLDIARADYWNTYCPSTSPLNSTLDFTLFNYTSENQNLTLYYGCPQISLTGTSITIVTSQFYCTIDNTNMSSYLTTNITDASWYPSSIVQAIFGECDHKVFVPVFRSAAQEIERSISLTSLVSALDGGFGVQWFANDELCEECAASGGLCGYDSDEFACFCRNGTFSSTCGAAGGKSKLSTGAGIGIGGAGIAGILLIGSLAYCMLQRRKRIISQTKSKDLSNPSSKGLTTPSTTFSQSIPSYPSSSSADLEKGSMYFGVQMFTYAELEEATDNFDASRELGDGGFGVVYFGKLRDGREVAVKRLYENNFKRVEQFMNEVEILTRLRHQNLVMLYGCTSRRSRELLLVYEYIPNGTVADHLHGQKENSGLVSWPVRLGVALETADALAYLHASDIIHRDVKTNNILLDKNFRVKVADFGLSRLFPTNVTHVSTAPQGTPGYVDPEYYQCYQLTNKSDVYSFGVVLVELISSKEAVDTNRHRHDINLANMALSKIQNHALHELVDPCLGFETNYTVRRTVTLVAELAFRCLQQEREVRPSMDEVLKVLRGIQVEELNAQKAETADTGADDVGLLKGNAFSFSPDSVVNAKWASNDATPNSF